jgi:NAD(P)-dependent dehydrogenase (short-subunit alcohol dehydrogenase family)
MFTRYNTNVFGAMQTFETFVPLLEKSPLPRVVFVSSTLGSSGLDTFSTVAPIYRSTKSALNMLVVQTAHRFEEKGWKINANCPGYLATNFNNFRGTGTVESGAINISRLATMGKDGETGTFFKQGRRYSLVVLCQVVRCRGGRALGGGFDADRKLGGDVLRRCRWID